MHICDTEVLHNSCNMGMRDLPDMYALSTQAAHHRCALNKTWKPIYNKLNPTSKNTAFYATLLGLD